MSTLHSILIIVVVVAVTVALRFLPFIIFPESRPLPKVLTYLGTVLPAAIMGMLVIYCFKDVSIINAPHGLPELIATAIVVILYLWRRKLLISVAAGTIAYMLLVQLVFI